MALEVVLEPLDPGGEVGRIAAGVIPCPLDVALVELVQVIVKTSLHLGPERAIGMVRQELAGLVDQVGERRVWERLGSNQVVDELSLEGGPA